MTTAFGACNFGISFRARLLELLLYWEGSFTEEDSRRLLVRLSEVDVEHVGGVVDLRWLAILFDC